MLKSPKELNNSLTISIIGLNSTANLSIKIPITVLAFIKTFNKKDVACIIPLRIEFKTPSPDSKDNIKPSHVELNNFISPSKLFNLSSTKFFKASS